MKLILVLLSLLLTSWSFAQQQPPDMIGPGVAVLCTNQTITNGASFTASTNTLLPARGPVHAIGLTLNYSATEITNIVGSNFTVTVYPANDVANPGNLPVFGTNFATNSPIATWSNKVTGLTGVFWTNLPSSLWEPATSLQFVLSNNFSSNGTFTLVAAPLK